MVHPAALVLLAGVCAALHVGKLPPAIPALRDALEVTRELPGAHGVFTMSANDHLGLDQRARVMVRIENGGWKLAK